MSSTSVLHDLWSFFALLSQAPFLVVFIAGIILAWQWKKTQSHPAGLVVVACALGVVSQLLSVSSSLAVRIVQEHTPESIAMIVGGISIINRLVHFIYITMLLYVALHPYFKNR
ncbi:MAG: hypothetical protein LBV12_01875 [Puniceicoccales bacterium]|jgi:Na+-transporting NADH:ubiquinone oxidoreductase subunit NqrD|nr:hypothetical protein [Puniceicoccales bacterium]